MADQENVKTQVEQAGKKASNIIDKIRNSYYGKKIPLELDRVDLKMLLHGTLIAKLGYIPPAYMLVVLTSTPQNFLHFIVDFAKSSYIFIALLDIVIVTCVLMSRMKPLYIGIVISLAIKNISLMLITLCYMLANFGFLTCIMWVLYMIATVFMDGLLAYYVGVYFEDLPEELEGEAESEIKRTQEDIAAKI